MSTKTRFEKEAKSNSEMAYCSVKPFMGKWSLEAWNKQVTRPSIVSKSLGTSLRYQVTNIFPLLSTLYILDELLANFAYTSHSF